MTSPRDPHLPEDLPADKSQPEVEVNQNAPTVGDHTLAEPVAEQVDPQATTKHGEAAHDPLQLGPARPANTVGEFVESLSMSGLMTPEELQQYQQGMDQGADPHTLVETLVRDQKLTDYQARALQRGHVRGLLLGNYEVLDRIGHGGMGVVYRARHRRMQREVALKILPSSVSGRNEGIERFSREVHAAARLQHPNIAAAFDADIQGGLHYLAMELIDGPNLSGYVKEAGPLPLAVAVQLMCQAARGLSYAHSQGVVHRDIKPGNLLVNRDGVLKILDMGLAQFSHRAGEPEQAELTQSGRIMGTVDYMAPEQAVDAKSVDSRADIYSVGCTLYYLLAGEPMSPPGPLTKKLLWHQNSPPPSLRSIRPEVPQRLDEIYLKMVAKTPEERQQSMAEVAEELEEVLAELSYSDLSLPMVGITLNANPSSVGGGSSRGAEVPPVVLGDAHSARSPAAGHDSSHEETVVMPTAPGARISKAPLVALIAVAVASLAMFLALGNWRTADDLPHRPPGVADGTSGEQPAPAAPLPPGEAAVAQPPSENAPPAADAPASILVNVPGDATVFVDDRQVRAFRSDPREGRYYPIAPGVHEVRIVSAGGADYRQEITVAAGEVVRIKPTFDVSPGSELLQHKALISWVFEEGGSIRALLEGATTERSFSRMSAELLQPFRLTGIDLEGLAITDDQLSRLLPAAGDLQYVSLAGTGISDAGAEQLRRFQQLQAIDLSGTPITAAAIASLVRLPRLTRLDLEQTDIGDAAVARLAALRNLQELDLSGTNVTDLGVQQLASLKNLRKLGLYETAVTHTAAEALEAAVPELVIDWEGPDLDRIVAEQVLAAGGTVIYQAEQGDTERRKLTAAGVLPLGRISLLEIDLSQAEPLGEGFFSQLPVLEHLTTLRLGGGEHTLQSLAKLRSSKSLAVLDIGELQIPEGTAALAAALAPLKIESQAPAEVALAQWAIDQQGKVTIQQDGEPRTVESAEDLPEYPFQISGLSLAGDLADDDQQIARVAQLPKLQVLLLPAVQATPAQVAKMVSNPALREVDLSGTPVNAAVLNALAKLPELTVLRLNQTQLTAAELKLLAKMPQLQELSLSQVSAESGALADMPLPPELKRLDLSGTAVDDATVAKLAQHRQLEQLNVKGTSLSDLGREQLAAALSETEVLRDPLSPASQVARWVIDKGGVVSIDGEQIASQRNLPRTVGTITAIDLGDVPPGSFKLDEIAQHLAQCTGLKRVVLKGQAFGDSVPEALLKSPGLQQLDLSNTGLRDSGLRILTELEQLKQLDLSHTRISRASVAALAGWPALESLALDGLPLADADLAGLAQLKNLATLSLGSRAVGDAAIKSLVGLPLKQLSLRGSRVGDAGLATLAEIGTLQVLDLGRTSVSDAGISKLVGLPLIDLRLDGTDITNAGLSTLGQMKSLRQLDISQTMATKEGVTQLRAALPRCHIPVTSLRSEEDRDQVPIPGGIFGGP